MNTTATEENEMTTKTRRIDTAATREFWSRIARQDRLADLRGNGKCATTYTSRDGGSELVCTESSGHTDSHYSGGR